MLRRSVWVLMLVAGLVFAQTPTYLVGPENFDGPGFPPSGWDTQDLAGANSWYLDESDHVARIDGNTIESENDWLFTNSFDGTTPADSIVLHYWYQISHWTGDTGQAMVVLSTDDGVTWVETLAVYPAASGTEINSVTMRIDNLSHPLSGTTKIAFVYNIYNGLYMMVDSVWVAAFLSEPAPPSFDHATYYHPTYPHTMTSYPETVYIDDVTGVSPSTAQLCYDVDCGAGFSGTFTCFSLDPVSIDGNGRGTYAGEIPSQPGWSTIRYYFQAEDTYIPSSIGYSDTFELVVVGNYYAYDNTDPYAAAPDNVFRDITGVGSDLGISADDDRVAVTLPFTFRFYGNDYTTIYVGTNGWLVFGSDPGTNDFSNDTIPSTSYGIDNFVAPLWDDLTMEDGAVYSYTSGDTFIIEWYNARELSGSVYYNFEVMLINPSAVSTPGGNGEIIVKYETMDTAGLGDATIGIENEDGTDGVCYLYDGTYCSSSWIVDGAAPIPPGPSAIKFTTEMPPHGFICGTATLSGETDHSGITVTAIGSASYSAVTTSSGNYCILVPIGTYDVNAYYDYHWSTDTVTGVTVTEGDTQWVNFTLERLPMAAIYITDLESDNGGLWTSDTTDTTGWEWGEIASGPGTAHSGVNVWATNLDGDYTADDNWRLISDTLDFSLVDAPIVLSFWHWYDMEDGYDGGNIKVSTDGGSTWNLVTPEGGYPDNVSSSNAGIPGEWAFTGNTTDWQRVLVDLSAYAGDSSVMIMWQFGSDGSVVYPGWYLDDIMIEARLTSYAVIQGHVTLSGETDHSGATVTATGPISSTDITATDGFYQLFVTPGTYTVVASKGMVWEPETATVTVAEGDTITLDFTLFPVRLGYVLGYVDLTDTPGSDAGILCELLGTGMDTLSDASGMYYFEAVPAGTYAIRASYTGYGTGASRLFTVTEGETTIVDTIYLQPEPLHFDFEADDGGFVPTPATGGWEWGTPTSGPSAAHSGSNCWATVLDDDYESDADWTLDFDLSSYSPMITEVYFWHWYDIETYFDGGNVQVSTDGGSTWEIVYPDGGYDRSSVVGLDYEPGFTGHDSTWYLAHFDLSAYTGAITTIRFRFGSDGSVTYPGWYIDDVVFPVLPQPTGCIEGYVYDAETYATIPGATVSVGEVSTTTDADGHFVLCDVPVDYYEVSGIAYGYMPNYVNAVVGNSDTAGPVYIPLYRFDATPSAEEGGLEAGLHFDSPDSAEVTICNPTEHDITLGVGIATYGDSDGGLFRVVPEGTSSLVGTTLRQVDLSNIDEYLAKVKATANNAPTLGRNHGEFASEVKVTGDIVDSFSLAPESSTPWGFACIGFHTTTEYWVSAVTATGSKDVKYNADGEFTGTYYNLSWVDPSGFAADMTYDGTYIWQVNVGGDNALYQWDPHTGAVINVLSDPDGVWDDVSQRGVGYDPALDLFYIGGWNDDIIYEVKGLSWDNPGEIRQAWYSPVSGLAGISFDTQRRTVWCATNSASNTVFEFDPATSLLLNVFNLDYLGANALAGCEIDASHRLWVVSMNQEKAYAIEIPGGVTPAGVAVVPSTITVPAGQCTTLYVISTGVAAPGIYNFDIVFTYQYDTIYALPAKISISRDIRLGWNLISVPVDADPNNVYSQLSEDIVPFYNEPGHSNIYAWDPERGMWVVPSEFQRGVGYYLLAWRDHSTIDVIGTPYYDDFVMTLPYYGASAYPGWNLVGNPVNTRIDWNNIVNDPMFSGIYPTYYNGEGGSYTPGFPAGADRYIDPYEGFFVVVMPGETGVLPVRDEGIYPTFARKSDDSPSGALPDFVLRISATVGTDHDQWNYIGVKPGATDGFDAQWDGLVPPTMTTDYLAFVNGGRNLSRDIRAPMTDGEVKTWQITIDEARRGDEVVISWPMNHIPDGTDCSQGMSQIYAGYTFQLYDPVTGEYVDMRSTDHYSFIYNGSRTLYIYVSAAVLNAEDKVPTTFALLQNTPNPFNASTEIQFALPTDGKVTLEVLDMSGRVVRTLVDGEMSAGFHRVVWDGRDKSGQEVASGVYFYRLKTDNLTQTRKMILVK